MPEPEAVKVCGVNDQNSRTPTATNDVDEQITTSLRIPCTCGKFRGVLGPEAFLSILETSLVPIGLGRNLIYRDFPMWFGETGSEDTWIVR